MNDIHILFENAGKLHGHLCPGLAIGVRAAAIAAERLGEQGELSCIAEQSACFLDGIQSVTGATVGNGRLRICPTGKTVFSFFAPGGESLRLYFKGIPCAGDKAERIECVLTAPEEELFSVGKARRAKPEYSPRAEAVPCARCGEMTDGAMLTERGGKLFCPDCAAL